MKNRKEGIENKKSIRLLWHDDEACLNFGVVVASLSLIFVFLSLFSFSVSPSLLSLSLSLTSASLYGLNSGFIAYFLSFYFSHILCFSCSPNHAWPANVMQARNPHLHSTPAFRLLSPPLFIEFFLSNLNPLSTLLVGSWEKLITKQSKTLKMLIQTKKK